MRRSNWWSKAGCEEHSWQHAAATELSTSYCTSNVGTTMYPFADLLAVALKVQQTPAHQSQSAYRTLQIIRAAGPARGGMKEHPVQQDGSLMQPRGGNRQAARDADEDGSWRGVHL